MEDKLTNPIEESILILQRAFTEIGANSNLAQIEQISLTIHKGMTKYTRFFHTMDHIFSLINPDNPIQTIAAFYHDLVYFQVDGGFIEEIESIINEYFDIQDSGFVISGNKVSDIQAFKMILEIFNVKVGDTLNPFGGQNELLSTIVMMKSLINIVTLNDIFKIAIYIEATIPFRKRDSQNLSCFDKNRPLLSKVAVRYSIDINEKDLDDLLRSAVLFANMDVKNFGDDNPGSFLDNTWRLLPETNPALRFQNCYTIGEYRISLQKMLSFLQNLEAGSVFQQFKNYPDDAKYKKMVNNTEHNITVARTYISIKLLTVGILESIAISTGGDVPLCYFMGTIEDNPIRKEKHLENFMPESEGRYIKGKNSDIYKLLKFGRENQCQFDQKNSPLTLFIYTSMDNDNLKKLIIHSRQFFKGEITSQQLLQFAGSELINILINALSHMVPFRETELLLIMKQLNSKAS